MGRAYHWLLLALCISLLQCESPDQSDPLSFALALGVPVVTGIHVTTLEMPDGTGETIGTPAYSISPGSVNVFENPYVEPDTIHRFEYYQFFVVFTHLPQSATVVIVMARWQGERARTMTSFGGATVPSGEPRVVSILHKSYVTSHLTWDLNDDDGHPVPTGVYRAFYFGDSVDGVKFIDISVTRGRRILTPY